MIAVLNNIQTWEKQNFIISTDKSLLEISKIHRFLSEEAYWSLNIPKEIVEKSIQGSLCFGLYDGKNQVGYARVITDSSTFAWLCDVYIEKSHRGQGLSKWLIECVQDHPDLKNLRRFCLATKDAHELYKQFGFEITKTPDNWMEIKNNDLYKKMKSSAE